jgi:hypothetical protein
MNLLERKEAETNGWMIRKGNEPQPLELNSYGKWGEESGGMVVHAEQLLQRQGQEHQVQAQPGQS